MLEDNLILCDRDYSRLMALRPGPVLRAELDRAIVVPLESIAEDVVRIGSCVTYRDHKTGHCLEIEIVLPEEVDSKQGRVSVLAPVGAALLGLRPGQMIEWAFPDGSTRSLTVISVVQNQSLGHVSQ